MPSTALDERAKAAALAHPAASPDEHHATRSGEDWDVDGIVAYSKICTHVGCPVDLYEQQTHHLLCPCHQSTFDVTAGLQGDLRPGRPAPAAAGDRPWTRRDTWSPASDFDEPVGPELLGAWMSASMASSSKAAGEVADDRSTSGSAPAKFVQAQRPQGLPGPLVVHARRDRALQLHHPAADRHVPDALLQAEPWPRSSTTAPTSRCTGLTMSEAYASTLRHLVRRPRRPAHAPDPPLGGAALRGRDHRAHAAASSSPARSASRASSTGSSASCCSLLGILEGFAGYSLPDDLLSGTGLRIADGVMLSIPVVGTYLSFFLFGGEFPGEDIIPRLYTVHILLIPGIILALITVHLILVWYQKHTQFPGPGRTEKNVVGYPLFPVYTAKAGGFFFIVFGVTALLVGVRQINPIWLFGPYDPSQVTAGSQPDWYMGFLDGALRMFPELGDQLLGLHVSWNILIPALIMPGLLFTPMALYPFLEALGDRRQPRAPPARPAAQRPDPHRRSASWRSSIYG